MSTPSQLPAPLAKLSPPRTAGLIPRPRLFQRLVLACARGAAWVYGPSGSGKTSLLATWIEVCGRSNVWYRADEDDSDPATLVHYLNRLAHEYAPEAPPLPALTPEYLGGMDTFARRLLRDLYARLPVPFVLVVDDVHQIASDSPSQRLLCIAVAEVPPGSAVVLCSRTAPAPALARFALHEGVLDAEDLKLDGAEALALLESIDPTHGRDAEALRAITQGWVVGFTLLASRPGELTSVGRRLASNAGDALFAYFTQEVFTRCGADERAFLVAIAPLASFTLFQAQKLTGREDAEEILETLRCGQFFITRLAGRLPSYRCHPLFHEFLCHEARRTRSAEEWRRHQVGAAALAEAEEDAETAASLYVEAEAWPDLIGLLCRAAPGLVAQGRHALLESWIGEVPTAVLDASPWLGYWLGTARVYAGRTGCGRKLLERAYEGFETTGERDGLLLAWGGIVESYSFEWDDCSAVATWATRVEGAFPDDPLALPGPVLARLFSAGMALQVVNRAHPVSLRLAALARGALGRPELEPAKGPALTVLLIDRLYGGHFREAQELLDLVMGTPDFARWPPVARMLFGQFQAACAWQTGNPKRAYDLVEGVLRQAEETGIHGSDFVTTTQGAYAALSAGDVKRALEYLRRLPTLVRPDRRGDAAHLGALTGCHKLLVGDLPGARVDVERALESVEALGMGFAALVARAMLAWVLALLGDLASARGLIGESLGRSRAAGTLSIEFELRTALALTELIGGDREAAHDALRSAFALGRQWHYFVTGPVWLPETMARLCAEALEAGIEPDYARELIVRRALVAPSSEVEHWPWPVRIHSLGRFGVFIEGEPLLLQRKGQGKPIQLLQALLALGGQDIAVDTLQDILWPDSEGDDAANAFNVTLLRLRRLLGESVLRLRDHRLSFDDRSCWVDAWALGRLVTRFDEELDAGDARNPDPRTLAERALGLYRGGFLPGVDAPWATAPRARLRSRFLRLLGGCVRTLREAGACEEAAALSRRVLEIEPIAEEILIEHLRALLAGGLVAQATAALRESELIFLRLLGRPPSPALWRLIEPEAAS